MRRLSRPPGRRAGLLVPLLAAGTLLALGGCGQQGGAGQGGGPVPVTVVTLKSEPVTLRRELPGRTSAFLVAEVRPQVDGIVTARLFTEGGKVARGQPLYQIDDARYRADYQSAQAALARAEALLASAQATRRRSLQMVQINAISKQDEERTAAALRTAEADVQAAQAALDRARLVLGYARVVAPISGHIGKSTVTQGALVTANQEAPLATVQQLDPIHLDLTQSSAEWLQLRRQVEAGRLKGTEDMPVEILLEDGSAYPHPGRLAFSDVTVDPATGSFGLRVVVPNPGQLLLPGMYLRAVIGTGVREEALLVPQQGIARGPKGATTAMVVGADGTVEQREVQVSQAIGDRWLVESGLAAGDRVIVEGLQKIRPGAQVQATEAGTAAAAAAPGQPAASGPRAP